MKEDVFVKKIKLAVLNKIKENNKMEHYHHINLDKDHYSKEEVEEIIHKVKCNGLIEENIRLEKASEDFKDFSKSLAAQL